MLSSDTQESVDAGRNPEFDSERTLLQEEFIVDSEGALTGLTYYSGNRFKFWEIFFHFGLASVVALLICLVLTGINGFRIVEVVQDGHCEKLLGWECPLTVPGCEGIVI